MPTIIAMIDLFCIIKSKAGKAGSAKKVGAILIGLFFVCQCAFSKGISFEIVQHSKNIQDVCGSTYVIEDEILNGLFDAGHIASNSPSAVGTDTNQDHLWKVGMGDAENSGFDAFLQVNLYFADSAVNSKAMRLALIDKVAWNLVNVANGSSLDSGEIMIKKPLNVDTEENVRKFAKDFVAHIVKVLR